jgi:hypothetical protein
MLVKQYTPEVTSNLVSFLCRPWLSFAGDEGPLLNQKQILRWRSE